MAGQLLPDDLWAEIADPFQTRRPTAGGHRPIRGRC
jgi:hypothetical protein